MQSWLNLMITINMCNEYSISIKKLTTVYDRISD